MHRHHFNKWNELKKNLHDRPDASTPHCQERDIWLFNIGKNIGVEQGLKNGSFARPVLVLKVFNTNMFWGVPITSANPEAKKDHPHFHEITGQQKVYGFASLSQMRLYDNKRLVRHIERLNPGLFASVREKIKQLI